MDRQVTDEAGNPGHEEPRNRGLEYQISKHEKHQPRDQPNDLDWSMEQLVGSLREQLGNRRDEKRPTVGRRANLEYVAGAGGQDGCRHQDPEDDRQGDQERIGGEHDAPPDLMLVRILHESRRV